MQSRGKSPSRSASKTRQEPSPRGKEIEPASNQHHHRRQSKKRADGLHTGRPGHMQHRNNKCTYFYPLNIGNTIGIQRAIKSKIRYKSDPSGKVINLSKHSLSLDTVKLLNKNLNFLPTPKK